MSRLNTIDILMNSADNQEGFEFKELKHCPYQAELLNDATHTCPIFLKTMNCSMCAANATPVFNNILKQLEGVSYE